MSEPKALKTDRQRCYIARDEFLACSDREIAGGLTEEQANKKCSAARKVFERDCPTAWVGHFIRKHNFERYKQQLVDQGLNVVDKNAIGGDHAEQSKHYSFPLCSRDSSLPPSLISQLIQRKPVKPAIKQPKNNQQYITYDRKGKPIQQGSKGKKDNQIRIPPPPNTSNYRVNLLQEAPNEALLTLVKRESPSSLHVLQSPLPTQSPLDPSLVTRYLNACRRCHLFEQARDLLRRDDVIANSLHPQGMMEAARLLAEASSLNQEKAEDVEIVGRLDAIRKQVKGIPPSVDASLHLLFSLVSDPVNVVRSLSDSFPAPSSLHCRSDILLFAAVAALRLHHLSRFIDLTKEMACQLDPRIYFWIIKQQVEEDRYWRDDILNWYLPFLCRSTQPLPRPHFTNLIRRMFKGLSCPLIRISNISPDGSFTLANHETLRLPQAPPISSSAIGQLRENFDHVMTELAEAGGCISVPEVAMVTSEVEEWRRSAIGEKAVVVDSLNVTHNHQKRGKETFSREFHRLIHKLSLEFRNVLLVTRPSQARLLRPLLSEIGSSTTSNIRIMECNRLSEDDLVSILAALQWGPEAYLLSNDLFRPYIDRMKKRESSGDVELSLSTWIQQRVICYDRHTLEFDPVPSYSRRPAPLTSSASISYFYMPVCDVIEGQRPAHFHYVVNVEYEDGYRD